MKHQKAAEKRGQAHRLEYQQKHAISHASILPLIQSLSKYVGFVNWPLSWRPKPGHCQYNLEICLLQTYWADLALISTFLINVNFVFIYFPALCLLQLEQSRSKFGLRRCGWILHHPLNNEHNHWTLSGKEGCTTIKRYWFLIIFSAKNIPAPQDNSEN